MHKQNNIVNILIGNFMNICSIQQPMVTLTAKEKKLFSAVFSNKDLCIEIIKWISDLKDRQCCALTCRSWKELTCEITHAQFKLRIQGFIFPSLAPKFSSPLLSSHDSWNGWTGTRSKPQIFCIHNSLIAIKPSLLWAPHALGSFCSLGPKPEVFNNNHILLGEYDGTYLFRSPVDSNELVVTQNTTELDKGRKIFLPNTADEESLESEDEEGPAHILCYPISKEKMILLTRENDNLRANSLDLKTGLIADTRLIDDDILYAPVVMNNHLFLSKFVINLANLEAIEHGIDFMENGIITYTYESYLYLLKQKEMGQKNSLESYFINSNGKLEKHLNIQDLNIEANNRIIYPKNISAVNAKYIALTYAAAYSQSNDPLSCIYLLDKEGNFIAQIHFSLWSCPKVYLTDDILIYQDPKEKNIIFWHIPTKQCVQQIKWDGTEILDIRLTKNKLIVLTSIPQSDKYQILQFDIEALLGASTIT